MMNIYVLVMMSFFNGLHFAPILSRENLNPLETSTPASSTLVSPPNPEELGLKLPKFSLEEPDMDKFKFVFTNPESQIFSNYGEHFTNNSQIRNGNSDISDVLKNSTGESSRDSKMSNTTEVADNEPVSNKFIVFEIDVITNPPAREPVWVTSQKKESPIFEMDSTTISSHVLLTFSDAFHGNETQMTADLPNLETSTTPVLASYLTRDTKGNEANPEVDSQTFPTTEISFLWNASRFDGNETQMTADLPNLETPTSPVVPSFLTTDTKGNEANLEVDSQTFPTTEIPFLWNASRFDGNETQMTADLPNLETSTTPLLASYLTTDTKGNEANPEMDSETFPTTEITVLRSASHVDGNETQTKAATLHLEIISPRKPQPYSTTSDVIQVMDSNGLKVGGNRLSSSKETSDVYFSKTINQTVTDFVFTKTSTSHFDRANLDGNDTDGLDLSSNDFYFGEVAASSNQTSDERDKLADMSPHTNYLKLSTKAQENHFNSTLEISRDFIDSMKWDYINLNSRLLELGQIKSPLDVFVLFVLGHVIVIFLFGILMVLAIKWANKGIKTIKSTSEFAKIADSFETSF